MQDLYVPSWRGSAANGAELMLVPFLKNLEYLAVAQVGG